MSQTIQFCGFIKFLPFPPKYCQQRRFLSIIKMTATPKWHIEKEKLLNLPLDEKRNLYKSKEHIILDKVEPWGKYVTLDNNILFKKPTREDITEFRKTKFNPEMNVKLTDKVSIFKGDITKLEIDAIVNAANSRLKAGGGVDGAIHRAAGPLLQEECDSIGGCPTGEARITGGYNLPAKYVIHTVGPQDGSESKLKSCYEQCFALQNENQIKSIAFPCISTGVYGFPNRLAAHVALRISRKVLENSEHLERVIFCTFMPVDVEIYETLMQLYFPTG